MNEIDKDLMKLFAEDEPTADAEAFVAAVHKRVAWRRRGSRLIEIGAVAAIACGATAIVVLAPEALQFPAQLLQSLLSSPPGAVACAAGAIGLCWWSRFGEA